MSDGTFSPGPATHWPATIAFILVCLMLAADAVTKLLMLEPAVTADASLGFDRTGTLFLGVLLVCCLLLYAVPVVRLLGAVLLTGYLGGATAIQIRAHAPLISELFPVFTGCLVWGALLWLNPEARRFPWLRPMQ